MRTAIVCFAVALVASGFALLPTASASPPTCEVAGSPNGHNPLGYVDCVIACVEGDVAFDLWPLPQRFFCL